VADRAAPNKPADPHQGPAASAARELAQLQQQAEETRALLARLQFDVAQAQGHLGSLQAAQLLEANEQLVLAMLRSQAEAETVAMDIAQRELTQELRLERQRLEAENRQIQESSRLKREFLSNMSHELRTPLNAVIGFADLLMSGSVPAGSSKHGEFVGHIASSGRHLLQLINEILDLSKVEAGKLAFFPEPVDLPQLVGEVTGALGGLASQGGLVIGTEIDASLTGIVLDPTRLKQVLFNYLSNAIKFTPDGGRVTVRARAEGRSFIRIEVEDTGIGIDAADQSRLFVEFQQLDSGLNKRHQGTGLGLALTRRLVQAQGGSVGVRSTPGVGSVFHLLLKRDAGSSTAAVATGLRRCLVIQDDLADQARISGAITETGFQVDSALTGEQAVVHARNQPYDAVVLDLVLPDRSGLEVLSAIRSHGVSRESPVLAVTIGAHPTATFAIADVLAKPIRTEEIVLALSRLDGAGPSGAKVMVIDDDPVALELMEATLSGMGASAVSFRDGRQALREIEQQRPDAIILDLMMPGVDGFAVLHALRQMPAWRATPVFIWTSMLLTDDEYARLARSARAILNKGGGALETLLDDLRAWRPAVASVLMGIDP